MAKRDEVINAVARTVINMVKAGNEEFVESLIHETMDEEWQDIFTKLDKTVIAEHHGDIVLNSYAYKQLKEGWKQA
jgi:hypothetical protein